MFSTTKKVLVAGERWCSATAVGFSTTPATQERTFTVFNRSSNRINHLYVSPTSYTYWGSDRLGSDIFYPNYRFDLSVAPGWYDIKLVDQDGDSCVVRDVDFRDGESWRWLLLHRLFASGLPSADFGGVCGFPTSPELFFG